VRYVWMAAAKDLRRLRRDPVSLALWLGIPVFVLLLMYVLFGRGETRPQGRLLIADEDGSFVSGLVVQAFRQEPLADFFRVEKLAQDQAQREVRRGRASALLIIPKGFGRAVLRNEPVQLRLITNPSQRILPGIAEEALSLLTDAAFYFQALAGDEIRRIRESAESGADSAEADVAAVSVEFYRIGKSLAGWLSPPRLKLETQTLATQSSPRRGFAAAFVPGMVFLALLFLAMGLSADLWRERAHGVLRRWLATPRSVESLLAGKLLAAMTVSFAVSLIALGCGLWIAGLPLGPLIPATLWCTFSAALFFLLLSLLQLYAANERTAHVLVNLALFPMILLGGSLFPFEVMPGSLARIGRLTPNGWALARLRELLDGAADPVRLAHTAAWLALVAAAAFLLAARRVRRHFAI
jgi:ABC-2 type transport system permease protein